MNYLKLVEKYITEYYQEHCDDKFTYHNMEHIIDVVENSEKIGVDSKLENCEMESLKIAAWFHDIGHITSKDNHEKISSGIAELYLKKINYPAKKTELVINCIKATDLDVKPNNLSEKIIKDADLFHLGSENYFTYCNKLFDEILKREICSIDYKKWIKASIRLFEKHNFYTDYAQKLNGQKNINLKKLYSMLDSDSLYANKIRGEENERFKN